MPVLAKPVQSVGACWVRALASGLASAHRGDHPRWRRAPLVTDTTRLTQAVGVISSAAAAARMLPFEEGA